jgi:hypothetical protein
LIEFTTRQLLQNTEWKKSSCASNSSMHFNGAYIMIIWGKHGSKRKDWRYKRDNQKRKSKKDIQHNGQQEKDKHGLQNFTQNNLNPTKNHQVWANVLQKGKQFLLKMWHPSCYSSYKPSDKSWMHRNTSVDCPQIDLSFYCSHDI